MKISQDSIRCDTRMRKSGFDEIPEFLPVFFAPRAGDEPAEVIVWGLDLDRPPQPIEDLRRLLSKNELTRADSFRFAHLRERFISAHGQVRLILGRWVGAAPAALRFAVDGYGRPALVSPAWRIDHNLSHSGGFALLAVSRAGAVGVDIEEMRDFADREAFSERSFAPAERIGLRRLAPDSAIEGFFACWTRKEAVVKADGRGLSAPLEAFAVPVDPAPQALQIRMQADAGGPFHLRDLPAPPGFRAALATRFKAPPACLRRLI